MDPLHAHLTAHLNVTEDRVIMIVGLVKALKHILGSIILFVYWHAKIYYKAFKKLPVFKLDRENKCFL